MSLINGRKVDKKVLFIGIGALLIVILAVVLIIVLVPKKKSQEKVLTAYGDGIN